MVSTIKASDPTNNCKLAAAALAKDAPVNIDHRRISYNKPHCHRGVPFLSLCTPRSAATFLITLILVGPANAQQLQSITQTFIIGVLLVLASAVALVVFFAAAIEMRSGPCCGVRSTLLGSFCGLWPLPPRIVRASSFRGRQSTPFSTLRPLPAQPPIRPASLTSSSRFPDPRDKRSAIDQAHTHIYNPLGFKSYGTSRQAGSALPTLPRGAGRSAFAGEVAVPPASPYLQNRLAATPRSAQYYSPSSNLKAFFPSHAGAIHPPRVACSNASPISSPVA